MGRARRGLFGFKSFSERGAWVEMLFMAAASFHGYRVLKPWGEVYAYDVGVEGDGRLLRVQVKSTSYKSGAGYLCEFTHSSGGRIRRYSAGDLDVCVGYVIPEEVWYIIPAHRITGHKGKSAITLCQFEGVRNRPKYEGYREAWALLGKDRGELEKM
ncbi:MAG TPA: group I intron-associated PD-(D/E)XK endonuclease [Candidatus Solibacter sp.]|nr:group I intron-associated PD-(D/E)XK endonuclease [Candidatus Solibacter sp.]